MFKLWLVALAGVPVIAFAQAKPGDPAMQMHQDMMKGSKQSMAMKPSGDIDRDFVTMMRHHHQTGIRMAEREMKNGKDEQAREFARKIAESQKQEIKEFDEWLKRNGAKK